MVDCHNWYILQVKSGSENTVLNIIENDIKISNERSNFIKEVFYPTSSEKTKSNKSKLASGYIFIKMNMNDKDSVANVLSIPSVIKFLGTSKGAKIISNAEIERVRNRVDNLSVSDSINSSLKIGDEVKIISGPFNSFVGKIEDIDFEKQELRVLLMIFGRSTPVDLGFDKIEKVK
ncbi:MAG: KOW motif-containing protein [Rickettsiaceae bacterium H1]|nr:KOW motif-containing protein [Rickettsiaceae bacterium H1]